MNLREGDEVSAVALVVETEDAAVNGDQPAEVPVDADADAADDADGVVAIEPTAPSGDDGRPRSE